MGVEGRRDESSEIDGWVWRRPLKREWVVGSIAGEVEVMVLLVEVVEAWSVLALTRTGRDEEGRKGRELGPDMTELSLASRLTHRDFVCVPSSFCATWVPPLLFDEKNPIEGSSSVLVKGWVRLTCLSPFILARTRLISSVSLRSPSAHVERPDQLVPHVLCRLPRAQPHPDSRPCVFPLSVQLALSLVS